SPVVHEGRVERTVSYPAFEAELRPYQQAALNAFLKYKSGLIVLPAGAGKTHVGVSAVYHSGQRTLWITHTKELAEQAVERFEDVLGIKPGLIGDGSRTIGQEVTV